MIAQPTLPMKLYLCFALMFLLTGRLNRTGSRKRSSEQYFATRARKLGGILILGGWWKYSIKTQMANPMYLGEAIRTLPRHSISWKLILSPEAPAVPEKYR
jgi:hypothetical protein